MNMPDDVREFLAIRAAEGVALTGKMVIQGRKVRYGPGEDSIAAEHCDWIESGSGYEDSVYDW